MLRMKTHCLRMLASGWMQILQNIRSRGTRFDVFKAPTARTVAIAFTFSLVVLTGCASPGPPLPPSLKLPAVVTDLSAARVGDEVRLRWTTPARTTDKVDVKGEITAEICREVGAPTARATGSAQACSVVERVTVKPGASEAVDGLPSALSSGSPQLLAYRVQLRNAVGRTAGPSAAVFAASGAAPGPVEGLKVSATKGGAVLEWRLVSPGGEAGDAVELDRTTVQGAGVPTATVEAPGKTSAGAEGKSGSPGKPKEPVEVRFRAGGGAGQNAGDPGGTIDRTAVTGDRYLYTAQRVRVVVLGGHTLEVRSAASGGVAVAMLDVFPPNAPGGLVASPGFVGDVAGSAQRPAIDLSWEPGIEARIAGYRVYRREMDGGGAWGRLDSALVAVPGYRDTTVEAGRRYGYRVTAVDEAGNESGPSGEIVETAPARER